eukprot:scaffold2705_cov109-Isochrysis_galbana.AAC.1
MDQRSAKSATLTWARPLPTFSRSRGGGHRARHSDILDDGKKGPWTIFATADCGVGKEWERGEGE